MKINCIVPVYNTSRYLKKCVCSLLNQTYEDINIILIDDCSTDNSGTICEKLKIKYPDKITYIKKEINEGVDKARLDGINYLLSNGSDDDEGVTFVDSDDYLEEKSLSLLAKKVCEEDADVVEMRNYRSLGILKFKPRIRIKSMTISQPILFDDYYISFFGENILSVSIWGKLYRLRLFREANLKPSGFKMGEDLILNMTLFPYIQKYCIIDYYGYNYRVGGLTSNYNPTLWRDLKKQYFIKRQQLFEKDYLKALRSLNVELKNIFITSVTQRVQYVRETESQLKAWILKELDDAELWKDVKEMSKTESKEIYTYLAEKNVDAILLMVRERLHAKRWRLRIKRSLITLQKISKIFR